VFGPDDVPGLWVWENVDAATRAKPGAIAATLDTCRAAG
jgi:hypothetical protein